MMICAWSRPFVVVWAIVVSGHHALLAGGLDGLNSPAADVPP